VKIPMFSKWWRLNMEAVRFSETTVTFYLPTRRNVFKELSHDFDVAVSLCQWVHCWATALTFSLVMIGKWKRASENKPFSVFIHYLSLSVTLFLHILCGKVSLNFKVLLCVDATWNKSDRILYVLYVMGW
jgi:hypothetical protein